MSKEKIVIESIEFEDEKKLELCGNFNDSPMYSVYWNGKHLMNYELYNKAEILFNKIFIVLCDLYGWYWCEECSEHKQGTEKYVVHYDDGHKREYTLCPNHYAAYCEVRMMDDGNISHIVPVDRDEHERDVGQ